MRMYHPEVAESAEVASQAVFDEVWAPRGWKVLDPEVEAVGAVLGRPITSLDDLTEEELATARRSLPPVLAADPGDSDAEARERREARREELDTTNTKDDLFGIVELRGLSVPRSAPKAEIIDAILIAEGLAPAAETEE